MNPPVIPIGTSYYITQLLRAAYTNSSHIIFSSENEAEARAEFDRLKQALPDEHFELGKIEQTLLDETFVPTDIWLSEKILAVNLVPRSSDITRNKAPWPDFKGNDIYEGDTIEHPASGERGIVLFWPQEIDAGDQWRVDYGGRYHSRLCLQIDDKGQAVVISEKHGS